jgi:hypothetical protein
VPLALRRRRFLRRSAHASPAELAGAPIERYLSDDEFSVWVRCLLMYAYSMHYDQVAHLSAAMVVPMLRDFLQPDPWTRLPEGVSSYVDRCRRCARRRKACTPGGARLRRAAIAPPAPAAVAAVVRPE